MAEFDSAIALALRLILKKGEAVTLRRFVAPTANVVQPWKPTAAATPSLDQTVRAVFLNFKNLAQAPKRYADGTQVREGDKRVLIAASGLLAEPDLNNVLVRGDASVWTIGYVGRLDPNGRAVLFEVWAKQ